jgi:hypothetical protein
MTILEQFERDPEQVLDRLVDGELAPHDRGQLLAALDDEPGAWRRCALAFLEAQSFRWQLSRAAAEPILAQARGQAPRSAARRQALWGGGFLALAASLAAAFVLGTRYQATTPIEAPIAKVATPPPAAQDSAPANPWQTVTLTPVDGGGEPIELRVRDDAQASAESLTGRPRLFGNLSRNLEQAGWRVDRRQGVLPIDLSDGRQLVVPIEEVDLKSPVSVEF